MCNLNLVALESPLFAFVVFSAHSMVLPVGVLRMVVMMASICGAWHICFAQGVHIFKKGACMIAGKLLR